MPNYMKAPEGVDHSIIQGTKYTPDENGIVEVSNEDHIEALGRFGYYPHYPEEPVQNLQAQIEGMDASDLVIFIEERGGEADAKWSLKKLRRIAREIVSE